MGTEARGGRLTAVGIAVGLIVTGSLAAGVLTTGMLSSAYGAPISTASTTTLVSIGIGGAAPDDVSATPDLSGDGRYVIFSSEATNLVAGDTNGVQDVFRRDQVTSRTVLVSRANGAGGAIGNDTSGADMIGGMGDQAISADGRWVVYISRSTNLAGGNPGSADVFVRDTAKNRTILVTRTTGGKALTGADSLAPGVDVSGNGRYVVFASKAPNLPGTKGGDVSQVFRRDLASGRTLLVSQTLKGKPGDRDSDRPVISDDGTKVGFITEAKNLGSSSHVFAVRDLARKRLTVESRLDGKNGARQVSNTGLISGDGTHIGWSDGNGDKFYVRSLSTGQTQQAAVLNNGDGLPGFCCYDFALSRTGRFVAAYAGDSDDTVYLRDRKRRTTMVVNRPTGADTTPQPSALFAGVALSGDGRFVAFGSTAADLAPDDYDGAEVYPSDVFIRDVSGPPSMRAVITGAKRQKPARLSVRVGCGAAMCDARVSGKVVATAGGRKATVFALRTTTVHTAGGTTKVVHLRFTKPKAVRRLTGLLESPAYRTHSRVSLLLKATGEAGSKSQRVLLRLKG